MWPSKASGIAILLAAALMPGRISADTAQIDSAAVRRVASHIACQCKACTETAACPMSMEGCSFCVPAKTKIVKMQQAGFSDQAIIDSFKKEYGPDIYRAGPNQFFWMIPYGALLLGASAIFWFVNRQYRGAQALAGGAPPPDDPVLARYQDAIEKESGRYD